MKQLNKTILLFAAALLTSSCLFAQVPHNHNHGDARQHDALDFNPMYFPFDTKEFRDSMINAGTEPWEVEIYIQLLKDREIEKSKWQKKLLPPDPKPQSPGVACDNADFEYGLLASWDCYTGTFGNGRQTYQPNPQNLNPLRHQITTGPSTDPYGNFPIVEPSGGLFSCQLGNNSTGAQAEVIEQIFMVTQQTTSFTYKYAVVLQDPNHAQSQQPYFKIDMLDANNQAIPCALYNVKAGAGIPGFQQFNGGWYKTWTTVNIDLTNYVGQNVTIRFETGDCSQGGHFGYAYIDGDCLPFYITASDTLCTGESVQLIAPPGAQSYLWQPGGQQTQIITVSQPGQYSVQSTSVTGCPNPTLFYYISQYPDPTATAIANPVPCTLTVNFQDNSTIPNNYNNTTINQWSWDFGDGTTDATQNPSHTYNAPGNYTVTFAVQTVNGCKDTVTLQVAVFANPLASFTATSVCQGTATQFTDASTTTAGVINQWAWDFNNDGVTDNTNQNPTYVFPNAGTFPVKLTITTNFGCSDDTIINVTVNPNPVAAFTSTSVCEGAATTFTDQSTVGNGNTVTTWTWIWGDGTPNGNTQNPTHTYAAAGTYQVTLNISSNNSCPGTITQAVTVNPNPVPDFTFNTPCLGQATTFTDISVIGFNNTITSWAWTYGDGATGNTQNPSHTYANPGNYNVTLTVTSNNGCTASITHPIVVNPTANAAFTSTSVCQGTATSFTDQSTVGNGNTITGWAWDFDNDGVTDNTNQNPTYVFPNAGTFQVMLTVTTNNGCQGQVTQAVTVHPNPVAAFTAPAVCLNSAMSFTDQSTVGNNNTVTGWTWDFGDGSPVNNTQNPSYTYANVGTYNVTLTVTTNNGCTATITQAVTVNPNPVAAFINTTECLGTATVFTDQSNVVGAGNNVTTWSWDFGDGAALDPAQNPTHTYATAGTYNVTLTVTTNNSCTNSVTNQITVHPAPQPTFAATTVCLNNLTTFTDQSTIGLGNTITSWAWDFGDGSPADNNQNPVHMYTQPGSYNVTLLVTSNNGCPASVTLPVNVNPLPVATFSATDVCKGFTMNFNDQSTVQGAGNLVNAWDWDFGDGTPHDNTQMPQHTYTTDGVYNVTLIVTTNNGCLDTVTKQVMVYPNPTPVFSGTNLVGCGPVCASFTDASTITSGSIASWDWDFGDGSTHGNTQNPSHCYGTPGTYTVTLTTTSDKGCVSATTIVDMIRVDPYPVAQFSASPQPTTIRDPKIFFMDKSLGATQWAWDFGDEYNASGDHSTEPSPSYNYTSPGTYDVTLVVTNTFGCQDTITAKITIGPDYSFYVPNAFTPNGDGINDGFIGKGEGIKEFEMTIYNRWGEVLYRTENINEPWDGTAKFRTQMCQQDVYVYKMKVTTIFGEVFDYVGDVTLVR